MPLGVGRPAASKSQAPLSIVVRGLAHRYATRTGSVHAIEGINLSIRRGELVALLGPSGCGKSTLLRALSGLLTPTYGEVLLAGRPPVEAHRLHGLGWLAQDDGLLPWRSVAANVALALELGGRARADQYRVQAMLERVGLGESLGRFPHELSGGMRQRAALARAIVNDPAFLFLDEPFANLDELIRERLGDLLLDVRLTSHPTTLLVTHSVTEAVRLADRVLVFSARPGRIVLEVSIDLTHPRSYDQPGFGPTIEHLKRTLRGGEVAEPLFNGDH
ncbi:MAG: ABC transporter ATP-binding protein [Chloroflexota bacterium]